MVHSPKIYIPSKIKVLRMEHNALITLWSWIPQSRGLPWLLEAGSRARLLFHTAPTYYNTTTCLALIWQFNKESSCMATLNAKKKRWSSLNWWSVNLSVALQRDIFTPGLSPSSLRGNGPDSRWLTSTSWLRSSARTVKASLVLALPLRPSGFG